MINNSNIHELVNIYLNNYESLPAELKKPIGEWDVSQVTNMDKIFARHANFNESIENWNVSNVIRMFNMFNGCLVFNQPLDNWNVSKVINMSNMFNGCSLFNQPLTNWNVSNVRSMTNMFYKCSNFNQSLMNWNVSKVEDMSNMFNGCSVFNQPLDNWNVSKVEGMSYMFYECSNFNQPLNNWNVSKVENMSYMFSDCNKFNQPLNNWNVSNVERMVNMFDGCFVFNQPLTNWNIDNNTAIDNMFYRCPISPGNKPRIFRIREPVVADAMHIHRESKKIHYTKLIEFLKEKTGQVDVSVFLPTYIKSSFMSMLNEGKPDKAQKDDLQRIMTERLDNLNYNDFNNQMKSAVVYMIAYVLKQPPEFQFAFANQFIKDCVETAYSGAEISCAAGVLERIIMTFTTTYTEFLTKGVDNPDWEKINGIIVSEPNVLITEFIVDWYKLHKKREFTEAELPSEMRTSEEKIAEHLKKNLKDYLIKQMNGTEFEELINKKIEEVSIGIGFKEDDFTYGGSKRIRKMFHLIFPMPLLRSQHHSQTLPVTKSPRFCEAADELVVEGLRPSDQIVHKKRRNRKVTKKHKNRVSKQKLHSKTGVTRKTKI